MTSQSGVTEIPITVDENKLKDGAIIILRTIRPTWTENRIKFKVFTDGITNKLIGCSHENATDDIVLVRVYGLKTDMLIDRKAETRNIRLMHAAGYAPRLYATFDNGLAYEFVPGETLTIESVRAPDVFPLVARMLARMHRLDCGPTQQRRPLLWEKTRQFMSIMPRSFSDPHKQARLEELIPSPDQLEREVGLLERELSRLGSPTVFGHNDLLLGNVVHSVKRGDVTFIDFEYSSYNYQAYDIANHFAEFAGVSEVDYDLLPSEELQRRWLEEYLDEFHSGDGGDSDGVERLLIQVTKFTLASHFFWAIWALIQSEHSTINFDYLGYASIRLTEYFRKKDQYLSLPLPS